MEKAIHTFFSNPSFAVVGASNDPAKYGHKIFVWYLDHSLNVTPVNPRAASISVSRPFSSQPMDYPTIPSLSALPDPKSTAVSIITPPAVTLKILKEAKELGIKGVWLQPGSFDDEGLKFAREEFVAGVGGSEGLGKSDGEEGWCILVDGEKGLRGSKI